MGSFCKFSTFHSSERILQIDQELTKLRPWLWWHPFVDSQCIYDQALPQANK